jgi:hypothetical protein
MNRPAQLRPPEDSDVQPHPSPPNCRVNVAPSSTVADHSPSKSSQHVVGVHAADRVAPRDQRRCDFGSVDSETKNSLWQRVVNVIQFPLIAGQPFPSSVGPFTTKGSGTDHGPWSA